MSTYPEMDYKTAVGFVVRDFFRKLEGGFKYPTPLRTKNDGVYDGVRVLSSVWAFFQKKTIVEYVAKNVRKSLGVSGPKLNFAD